MKNRVVIIVSGGVADWSRDENVNVCLIDLDNIDNATPEDMELIRINGYEDLIPDYVKQKYMSTPKGADITLRFGVHDVRDIYRYASFGEYCGEDEPDSFGVPEDEIFFYFESEDELKEYMKSGQEFLITEYNLVY